MSPSRNVGTPAAAMRRALGLARRGLGRVSPNPPVGAIAVRDGVVVGEGWHREFGGPHAEADLLARAGEACRGADLFVTLEPCAHHGKTPPCSDAVLAAGFRRVYVACDDPNPITTGQSFAQFARAGLEVVRGVEEAAARALLAPYLCRTLRGRPLVTGKWAMTADGRIATAHGDSKWISSEATRRRTRAERSTYDAILVGRGTALADDPLLTARTRGRRDPCRVILDSTLSLPPASRLIESAKKAPLLVVASESRRNDHGFEARRDGLIGGGADVVVLPGDVAGRVAIEALLDELAERGISHLLVEGGAEVLGSFLAADRIDRVQVIIAPKLCGGTDAKGPVGGEGIVAMADARTICDGTFRTSGGDRILDGAVTSAGRGESPEPAPDAAI